MKFGFKIGLGQFLFTCAFLMIFLCSFYQTTTFMGVMTIGKIYNVCRAISALLIIFKCVYVDRYNFKSMIFLTFLFAIGVIGYYCSRRGAFLDTMLLMAGASNLDSKKIVKLYFWSALIFLAVTFLCCKAGIIIDYTTVRTSTGRIRHSYGIVYATDFAAHVLFIYLSYYFLQYQKRKIKIYDYAIAGIIVYLLDKFCNARLSESFIFISLVLFTVVNYWRGDRNHKIIEKIVIYSFPVCAVFSVAMTIAYNSSNAFWVILDEILFSRRLRIGKKVIETYGFSLFGRNIPMQGMGYKVRGFDATIGITYLDSSYMQLVLLYGVVSTIFVLIIFVVFSKRIVEEKNAFMYMMIIVLATSSIINQYLISIAYNPFVVVAGTYAMASFTQQKQINYRYSIK